jgi:hypothetical protein
LLFHELIQQSASHSLAPKGFGCGEPVLLRAFFCGSTAVHPYPSPLGPIWVHEGLMFQRMGMRGSARDIFTCPNTSAENTHTDSVSHVCPGLWLSAFVDLQFGPVAVRPPRVPCSIRMYHHSCKIMHWFHGPAHGSGGSAQQLCRLRG